MMIPLSANGLRTGRMGYLLLGVGLWSAWALSLGLLGPTKGLALTLALAVLVAVIVVVRRAGAAQLPALAGALLLFVLYTRVSDVGIAYHGLPSVAQPFVLLLAALTYARRTRTGGARGLTAHARLWQAVALYAAVLFASSIWASDGGAAVKEGVDLLKNLLILYIIVETFDTPQALRLAVWSLIAAGSLLAVLSVVQAVTHAYNHTFWGLAQAPVRGITVGTNSQRSAGPVGDPNFYALIEAALVPLAFMRARDEQSPGLRCAAVMAIVVQIAAVVLTYSRGGMVTLGAIVLLCVPLARVRPAHIVAALVLFLPLAVVAPASYWQRLATLGSVVHVGGAQGDNSLQDRAGAGQVAMAMFEDHPLTGVGAGNYPVTYFPYALRLNVPKAASYSHDLYLQVAAETGLLGLVTFSSAVLLALRAAWRRRAAARRAGDRATERLITSCLLSVLTYLIGWTFLPGAYPRYLWMLVGLAMAAALVEVRRDSQGSAARVTTGRERP